MKVKLLVIVAIGSLVFAACDDDETTNPTGGNGGNGGSGGGEAGAGGDGGDAGMGGGGGSSCLNCGDYLVATITGMGTIDQLCGYVSGDPSTMDLMCEAGSSCEKYGEVVTCTCVTGCMAQCATSACMGMAPDMTCINCADANCGDQQDACFGDM